MHLLMHSLVEFSMCLDLDSTHNLGIRGWYSNQMSYLIRTTAGF